jgi:putative phage-type endonuclease
MVEKPAEWHELRRTGIGGSDAAAVCGLNPWKSIIEVWMEKTGMAKPNVRNNEKMYWGTRLEDLVAEEFAVRSGLKVRRVNETRRSIEHPFMLANIDRKIEGQDAGLECKTTSEWMRDKWTEENLPPYVVLQCQHYMVVTGWKTWWVAVLIGGQEFRMMRLEYDPDVARMLVEKEREFWTMVETNTMPAPDGSEAASTALGLLYPEASYAKAIRLPDVAGELIAARQTLKAQEDEIAERRNEAENKLKALMGDAEKGEVDIYEVRWKNVVSARLDTKKIKTESPETYEKYVKESTSRRFEIKELKEAS